MASRKVLQEIAVLPPKTEEQSFVVVTEEAMPDSCNQLLSLPARAHAKYISNDEAKENITPAQFDTITKEQYKCEKSELGKSEPRDLGDLEGSGSGSRICLQHKDEVTLGMTAGTESIFTPNKDRDCSDWRIGASNTPMDFSKVTVQDFGISSDSFTNSVGKSPRSLHKHRRRSTIGVRGSPEMNFLIRQIALQRSNRKMDPEPLHLQSNPFTSPHNSVLKEKMSSFRNAFQAVDENEGKLQFPGFSEEEETQESKDYGNAREKPEPPVKRKRVCDTSLPEMQSAPLSTQPPKTTPEIEVPVLEKISESDGSSTSRLSAVSKSVNLQSEEIKPPPSSTRGQKRKVMFAEMSSPPQSKRTLCHNETLKSDCTLSSSPALRPVLKKTPRTDFSLRDEPGDQRVCFSLPEPSENENNTLFKKTVNDSVKKRKRVTFGRELSPELFDKTLPANTPLRKGSTPCRQHESDTAMPPVQEMAQSPYQSLSQPDFDCRDEEDTFKPLSLRFDSESPNQDSPDNIGQIWPTEGLEDVIHENNHKEEDETILIYNNYAEDTSTAAPALGTEIVNESFIASEPDTVPSNSIATRSCKKSKQACSSEDPPTSDTPQTADAKKVVKSAKAKPSKRGRKPVIIKQVQGKGKKGRGKPKKSVQKSLYGARETVSKKPPLSPIPELPECCPTPPASTLVSPGGTFNKGRVKRIPKRKGISRDIVKISKNKAPTKVVELFSDPVVMNTEDNTEAFSCPRKEGLEVEHTTSITDGERHIEPADLVVQVDTLSPSVECPLPSAGNEVKQDEECIPEPSESVPEDKGTMETMTALKPPNKSKRRSTTRRRASQTTTEVLHVITETPAELIENHKAEHNTVEIVTEDPQPEKGLLVEDRAESPKEAVITGVVSRRRGRPSLKNYHTPALFCPSTEPNSNSQDLCTLLHPENSSIFINEPCLPIDEILQPTGTEKKVRRSLRLRRDSGASGLFWVQENTVTEHTSRRKSLSSALQSLECPEFILESVACSPNKEQPNVQQVPSAAKKTRRRTLCTSSLQLTSSVCDTKRRRSNVSYKDSSVPSAETCHNSITPDT